MTADTLSCNNPKDDLVARPDFAYRWRVYVLALVLVLFGLWCVRDGFFRWPQQNARNADIIAHGGTPVEANHSPTDILLNKALGIGLPALGVLSFLLRMYRSRGAYVLSGDTLSVPGQAPVPLDSIESLDKTNWDRKGVALVEYTDPGGKTGTLKLQDMIYDRRVTDEIVDRLERHLNPQAAADSDPQQATPAADAPAT